MKVYFSASLEQKGYHQKACHEIVACLQKHGHVVFERAPSFNLKNTEDVPNYYLKDWFKEWCSYITECDTAVIEGSYPSTICVGFEIGVLLSRNKPVILLYHENEDPVFINSYHSNKLIKSQYADDNISEVLDWCFNELERIINRRFTFFVSPEIEMFLDHIAKHEGTSRAEYIRLLIEREMKKHR